MSRRELGRSKFILFVDRVRGSIAESPGIENRSTCPWAKMTANVRAPPIHPKCRADQSGGGAACVRRVRSQAAEGRAVGERVGDEKKKVGPAKLL